jgi:hypothetical protein
MMLGCLAGVPIYFAARAACFARNAGRARLRLPAELQAELAPHFPDLDLGAVRLVAGASLPPNWLGPKVFAAAGMTFGQTIFLAAPDPLGTLGALGAPGMGSRSAGMVPLIGHELVHVDQVRRLGGERAFACAYGRGYLAGGSYRRNPLEVEAYEVEERIMRLCRS